MDRIRAGNDTPPMEQDRSSHFVRRDAARNMNRFYRLTVVQDLFGTALLVREWGRIGVSCRTRCEEKESVAEARRDAVRLAAGKMRRGYVPAAGQARGR